MILKCSKCNKDVDNTIFQSGEIFKGIDEHHNPPKFLTGEDNWNKFDGRDLLNLCRDCHRELHNIILIMMNKKANTLKFNGSEYWLCRKMSIQQKEELAKEVFEYTNQWISQKD